MPDRYRLNGAPGAIIRIHPRQVVSWGLDDATA
jgi:hypothetical protein